MAENTNSTEVVAVTVTEEKNKPTKAEAPAEGTVMKNSTTQMKYFTNLLTILSFLLSLPLLASLIWLLYMKEYDCEHLLRLSRLQIGIIIGLIFVFLVNNGVVFLRARFPLPGLLLAMVPLLVMLIVGLGLIGADKMESRTIPATPIWLKTKVYNNNNWNNIKSCIFYTKVCDDLVSRSLMLKSYDFSMKKLSSMESGCCKPPSTCEMEFVNATFWRKEDGAANKSNLYDSDCDTWDNNQNICCYNCRSCKEGFLRTIQSKWWKLGTFLVVMTSLLIISHLLLFTATMLEQYGG